MRPSTWASCGKSRFIGRQARYQTARMIAAIVATGSSAPRRTPDHTCAKGVMVPVAASRALVVVGMAGTQALPDTMRELQELRRLADIERALVSEVAVDHVDDPSGARRHHHDQRRKEHGLRDRMGDKDDGFSGLFPEFQELLVEPVARDLVERAKRLVHQ